MAWATNFKQAAVANALPRNRLERIKQFFHLNDNSKQPQKETPEYDKFVGLHKKLNEISQEEEYQSIYEQMLSYKGQQTISSNKAPQVGFQDVH
ncbi:unnamed protein product [Ceratitis capitata]|uniref:(Mediterranean fruit fly) hypothetical protein n=1 Tax=Ceratitis capitata TaxID=7213 RepID=A0A811UPC4_CERCA|nr:unnamed protein product [Ceratitis capitata]